MYAVGRSLKELGGGWTVWMAWMDTGFKLPVLRMERGIIVAMAGIDRVAVIKLDITET